MQQVVIVADPEEVDELYDMLWDMYLAYARSGGDKGAYIAASSRVLDEAIEAGEPVAIH